MDITKLLEEKEKRKAYNAEYYKKNKDKKKKYSHEYYLKNKKEINERNKEWAKRNTIMSKKIFIRQKDILGVLSKNRKEIGDSTYRLLISELEQMDKHTFKT